MYERFVTWSEQSLGQWHYVLGYALVLISHNWPIMLALIACAWFGLRAYRNPQRKTVSWLLTAMLLAIAYEYDKHVAPELHLAIDFLFGLEIAWLNRPLHRLVSPVLSAALTGAFLIMLAQSIRLTLLARNDR